MPNSGTDPGSTGTGPLAADFRLGSDTEELAAPMPIALGQGPDRDPDGFVGRADFTTEDWNPHKSKRWTHPRSRRKQR